VVKVERSIHRPSIRSPSQSPGTALSSTEAGPSLIGTAFHRRTSGGFDKPCYTTLGEDINVFYTDKQELDIAWYDVNNINSTMVKQMSLATNQLSAIRPIKMPG